VADPFTLFADEAPQRYPDVPGYRRRDTSKAAAVAITPRAGLLRDRVLAEIARRPSTPDEVAKRLGETVLAVRPRFSELVKGAKIIDSGERRKNDSGRSAIVWRAA
jgi:hypothetical protein